MILQKQHNIFNLFLLFPALCNLSDTLFSDSLHFPQPEDIGLNHSDRLCSELLHDPFCIFGTNPFDQPRTQIFFNAKNSRRHRLFPGLCLKLSAIATVHFPVSVDQKHRTNIDIQKTADHRHQILIIFHCTLQDRITVVRILVSDPLHHRTQFKSTAFPYCRRCGILCLAVPVCFCRIDSSVIFCICVFICTLFFVYRISHFLENLLVHPTVI